MRRVWRRAAPTPAAVTPPALRPSSAVLDATGVQEETHTATTQNAAPVMNPAFFCCCSLVASVAHWHAPPD